MKQEVLKFIENKCIAANNKLASRRLTRQFWDKHNSAHLFDTLLNLTSFLDEEVTVGERIFCLTNNITSRPICLECDTPTRYSSERGYAKFCSAVCSNKSEETKRKKKESVLDKYGVDCVLQIPDVKERIDSLFKEKYGGRPSNSPVVIEKMKKTKKERYGSSGFNNMEKRKKTNKERYGYEHALQSPDVRAKTERTNLSKYGVVNPSQAESVKDKIRNTSLEKYGVDHFKKSHYHETTKKILENPEELRRMHYDRDMSVPEMAEILEVSPSNLGKIMKRHGIRVERKKHSHHERQIMKLLDSWGINYEKNVRGVLGNRFEIDIWIPSHNIGIEYHGVFWHCEYKSSPYLCKEKMIMAREHGIRLVQIFEDEWVGSREIVESKLKNILGINHERIHARNCNVAEISPSESSEFLDKYHIQGRIASSVNLGLFSKGSLVAVMTFKRTKVKGRWDLVRFASSSRVSGGFSKMLTFFKRTYEWDEIITFADLRWSTGNLYLRNGFEYIGDTPPNYSYVYILDSKPERIPRYRMMKHKMKHRLAEFSEDKTEVENARDNGYYRIFDAGHMKFIMKR